MEPGPRPSTARQALPERSPVAGPSRSCSAARLALAGAPTGRATAPCRAEPSGRTRDRPQDQMGGRQSPGAVSIVFRGHARGQLAPCTSTTGRPTEAAWPSVGATLADRWPSRCHGADLAVRRRTSYRRGQSTSGPRVLGPGRTRGTGRASARPVLRVAHAIESLPVRLGTRARTRSQRSRKRAPLGPGAGRKNRPATSRLVLRARTTPGRAARYQRRSRPNRGIAAIFSSVRSFQRIRGNVQLRGRAHRSTRSGVTMTSTWRS